jgi:hypothetical protein
MPLGLTVSLFVVGVVVLVGLAGYLIDASAEPEEREAHVAGSSHKVANDR